MSTADAKTEPLPERGDASAEPRPRRWTRGEFHRLAEQGLFAGRRVELVEGEVLEMTPQTNRHMIAVDKVREALHEAFGAECWVFTQGPLALAEDREPEPDVAVVPGRRRDYLDRDNPSSALLVVEVSHRTLKYDRETKASMYAAAGIEDYWVVNLIDRRLEVFRRPIEDEGQRFGWGYGEMRILKSDERVKPLRGAGAVRVADLLP